MTPSQLIYSRKAELHLRELERYIAERETAEIAANYIDRIQTRCEKLLLAPYQGTRPDSLRPGV